MVLEGIRRFFSRPLSGKRRTTVTTNQDSARSRQQQQVNAPRTAAVERVPVRLNEDSVGSFATDRAAAQDSPTVAQLLDMEVSAGAMSLPGMPQSASPQHPNAVPSQHTGTTASSTHTNAIVAAVAAPTAADAKETPPQRTSSGPTFNQPMREPVLAMPASTQQSKVISNTQGRPASAFVGSSQPSTVRTSTATTIAARPRSGKPRGIVQPNESFGQRNESLDIASSGMPFRDTKAQNRGAAALQQQHFARTLNDTSTAEYKQNLSAW